MKPEERDPPAEAPPGGISPSVEQLAARIESRLGPEEGALLGAFFRRLHARTRPSYFAPASFEEIAEHARSVFDFFAPALDGFRVRMRPGDIASRRPLRADRVALETVCPDQPFLFDSLLEVARVRGYRAVEAFHPVFAVERGPEGRVTALRAPRVVGAPGAVETPGDVGHPHACEAAIAFPATSVVEDPGTEGGHSGGGQPGGGQPGGGQPGGGQPGGGQPGGGQPGGGQPGGGQPGGGRTGGDERVSFIRLEIEGVPPEDHDGLLDETRRVLEEARLVVQDFQPMLDRLEESERFYASLRGAESDPGKRDELHEVAEFLGWLRRANFVFLGFRTYAIRWSDGEATVEVQHGSGLGILRAEERSVFARPAALSALPRDVRDAIAGPGVILVGKANSESRILRRTRMDQIVLKRDGADGRPEVEHLILGLWTAKAYNDLPSDIPLLRRKLALILERGGILPGSHDHKEVFSIFTSIPKSELFAMDADAIGEMVYAVMEEARRRGVRVTYRLDLQERRASVMVLLPKERFNVAVRTAIQDLLVREFRGTVVDYRLALSDEPMARLHFYLVAQDATLTRPSLDRLQAGASEIATTWDDRLERAIVGAYGEEAGVPLADRYSGAFPASYAAQRNPGDAVDDIRMVEETLSAGDIRVAMAEGKPEVGPEVGVLKVLDPGGPLALSTLMPILTDMGLHVIDEQIFPIEPRPPQGREPARAAASAPRGAGGGARAVYLHRFRVRGPGGQALRDHRVSRNVAEIIPRILRGDVENDALNSLVIRAGLDHRQVEVLRAYDEYLRQLGVPLTRRTSHAALCQNPAVAVGLVRLFEARFDPRVDPEARAGSEEAARARLGEAIEKVAGIQEDRVLRLFENAILSTVRTSHFRAANGDVPPALALKIRSRDVRSMPDPRPLYEIFVHGPSVEGVHLRSGKVARGGIRWSSRPDDYRMEILGLMRAQNAKNAVIVPVGAKGGFILKRAPTPPSREEVLERYRVFIGALLDVTDDIVEGRVAHPRDVVVHDEEDPYLVVAADRGTATFSDVANEIALSRGFWLGDAFASGGSRGYDHKKIGITAEGAWQCIRRHFHEIGVDPEKGRFTACGIGDMSGDVFGNGLLASRNVLLVAAFNHAHVFLDPDPDPETSYEERLRLFRLPASAWTDYDLERLSAGGGVWRRDSKAIPLSREAREMLGIAAHTVNGVELVRAILTMPVDLLFSGGIGTYVKASSESNAEVADPANDEVRVDGAQVRARVVAEGGNLGFTQLGRVEYARAGGRINADFIDNSGGVDLSDHEVNLKILLAVGLRRGEIRAAERDGLLVAATTGVVRGVLEDNRRQALAISLEEARGAAGLDEHRLLLGDLAARGVVSRAVERMPEEAEILRLREAGEPFARPQIAVLLAYAKIDASAALLATGDICEADLRDLLGAYFPEEVLGRVPGSLPEHPLRREIATTVAVNDAINRMGVSFFHRLGRRTGSEPARILCAYLAASELAGAREFHGALDDLLVREGVPPDIYLRTLLGFADAVERAAIGLLRRLARASSRGSVRKLVGAYAAGIEAFLTPLGSTGSSTADGRRADAPERPEDGGDGLPPAIRKRFRAAGDLADAMDMADLAAGPDGTGPDGTAAHRPETVRRVWDEVGAFLLLEGISREAARVRRVTADDHQTCASLVERIEEHRRATAGRVLSAIPAGAGPRSAEVDAAIERALPAWHPERARVARALDAGGREPLTPSALYVLIESSTRL